MGELLNLGSRDTQESSENSIKNTGILSWINVFSLQPLILQYTECGQRFYAFAPKMLVDLPAEIDQHVRKSHDLPRHEQRKGA